MENSNDGLEFNNFTEDEMWMFIGDNAEFYIDKWRTAKNPKVYARWNWATFFAGMFWFGYRKTLSNIKKIPQDELTFQGMLLKKGGNSWG